MTTIKKTTSAPTMAPTQPDTNVCQEKPEVSQARRQSVDTPSKAEQKQDASSKTANQGHKFEAKKDVPSKAALKPEPPKKPLVTSQSAYFQNKGTWHTGAGGKTGPEVEVIAAERNAKIGTKETNAEAKVKVGSADAKSIVNSKERSAEVSASATVVEVGGTINKGNYGVGAKIGVGVGATGRVSLCDDVNKDGKKEISIELTGAILGKFGLSVRFPNPFGSYVCPK